MKRPIYNVLWLDDDFLPGRDVKKRLIKFKDGVVQSFTKGNLIIDTVSNATDFQGMIKQDKKYDAFILDVRGLVQHDSVATAETEAFFIAASAIREYDCVKIILSGETAITYKEDKTFLSALILAGMTSDDVLDKSSWMARKVKFGQMLVERIEFKNTPIHRLRSQYPDACEAAQLLERESILVDLFENDDDDPETSIRKISRIRNILEVMIDYLKDHGIIPNMKSVSSIGSLFQDGTAEQVFFLTPEGEKLMPVVISHQLSLLLKIVNDAHHSKKEMKLHVEDYLRDSKDANLVHTVTYMFLSLLEWFLNTVKKYPESVEGVLWIKNIVYKDLVLLNSPKFPNVLYVKYKDKFNVEQKCKIINNSNRDYYGNLLKEGCRISMLKEPNKSTQKSYNNPQNFTTQINAEDVILQN